MAYRIPHEIPLGQIIKWPGGYAMTLGTNWTGAVCCCDGHETPEAAREHGLVRAIEVVQETASRYVAEWADVMKPGDRPSTRPTVGGDEGSDEA